MNLCSTSILLTKRWRTIRQMVSHRPAGPSQPARGCAAMLPPRHIRPGSTLAGSVSRLPASPQGEARSLRGSLARFPPRSIAWQHSREDRVRTPKNSSQRHCLVCPAPNRPPAFRASISRCFNFRMGASRSALRVTQAGAARIFVHQRRVRR
jgi:hypothetical protein